MLPRITVVGIHIGEDQTLYNHIKLVSELKTKEKEYQYINLYNDSDKTFAIYWFAV